MILPLGAVLTQYTITGYDASVHLSEETKGASNSAAKGITSSILYSALGGWVLLLSLLFAVQDKGALSAGGGGIFVLLGQRSRRIPRRSSSSSRRPRSSSARARA